MNRIIKFRVWDGREMSLPTSDAWFKLKNGEIELPKDYIIMQYTGLKDKNGVEIYEGDIIEYDDHSNKPSFRNTALVEYEPQYASYQIISGDLTDRRSVVVLWAFDSIIKSNAVVIGNFYESLLSDYQQKIKEIK